MRSLLRFKGLKRWIKKAGYKENVVPKAGLEPARVAPLPPQDSVSTRFHHFGILKALKKVKIIEPVLPAVSPRAWKERFFQVRPALTVSLPALFVPSQQNRRFYEKIYMQAPAMSA